MAKKYASALFFFLLITGQAFAATLPSILVEKVDPQPVEPGRDITIDAIFFNRLAGETGSFAVELRADFPIVFKSASEDFSQTNICGSCSRKNKYFLAVDPKAVSGTYPVFIRAYSDGVEVKQRADINVQGKPNIVFTAAGETLGNITPSSRFSAYLYLTNIGSGQARQIKMQPESAAFSVLGGSVKTLNTLNANESSGIVFDFVAASELEANAYAIPFRIIYLDEQGNQINSSQSLGVRVINKGQIEIQAIKAVSASGSSLLQAGQPFTVVARLENTGHGDADAVSAEATCPFSPGKKAFVGQLKKDEDAPAVFDFISAKSGTFSCDLKISYKDDTGTYSFTEDFGLSVGSQGLSGVLLPAIAAAVAIFIFRKRIFSLRKKQHANR